MAKTYQFNHEIKYLSNRDDIRCIKIEMSLVNYHNSFTITTKSDKDEIMFKNYLFELKRTNKNENQIQMCTYKLCNASIIIRESSIAKT